MGVKGVPRQSLDRSLDLELEGRQRHGLYRLFALGVLGLVVLAALLGAFGQESTMTVDAGQRAALSVDAPPDLRGGLLFQARFEVHAKRRLAHPNLVLSPGWLHGMTLNTVAPTPVSEESGEGGLTMSFEALPAGETLVVWTDWQVNPTNVGRRDEDVALFDGAEPLASVQRTVTVFP